MHSACCSKEKDLNKQENTPATQYRFSHSLDSLFSSKPVEHCVERRGETLTIAREAGTPTRLVRSNALFCGLVPLDIGALTRRTIVEGRKFRRASPHKTGDGRAFAQHPADAVLDRGERRFYIFSLRPEPKRTLPKPR